MAGMNLVLLIGRLGSDPEIRYTQGGTAVCRLSVATSRSWLNKQSNEREEETEWHRVVVWSKQAEHCEKYLAKGSELSIRGRLKTSSYDDKDGQKRYSTEIVAEEVIFIGKKSEGSGSKNNGKNHSSGNHGPANPEDDDIPF